MASDHGLEATVAPSLAPEPIAHIDQTAESDLHLLRRLPELQARAATVLDSHIVDKNWLSAP